MNSPLVARDATPSDYDHFVRLFPELLVDDPIAPRDRWERVLMPETVFFEADGAIAGYIYLQILSGAGYVRHVIVDPSMRGRGVGRQMMDAIASRLRAAGADRWCLNVKPENTPAVKLYERVGMRVLYPFHAFRFPWELVDRLPRGDREVIGRAVEPDEDARVEAAFKLPPGQVTAARKKGGIVLMRLVDPAHPDDVSLGFASFDPEFPGSFPFRVGHPTLAVELLEALCPHARPELDFMQCVVEDDLPLAQMLLAAGASLRMSAVHMEGPL